MALKPELLEILVCPQCRSKVIEREESLVCSGADCRRRYAIHDGIPVMLIDESEVLDAESWKTLLAQE